MVKFNTAKLGEVCEILNGDRGYNYPSSKDFVKFGIPFINAGSISGKSIKLEDVDYISKEHYNKLSGAKLKKGDIVFCLRGSLGKYALLEFDEGAPASSLAVLRAYTNKLNSYFLLHTLGSDIITNQINMQNNGSSQPNLSAESVKEFVIPLPEILEQNVIAEALSDIDNLIISMQKLIDKKKAIKQGAMQELLTGKRHLPDFASKLEIKTIGDLCQIVNGGTPSTLVSIYWNGNIPWCTPTDITACNVKYIYDTKDKITEYGVKSSSANILPKGTLLLCSRATIGEVRIAGKDMCTNQGFKSLVVYPNVNNVWLYYAIQMLKPMMLEKAIGSTFLEISKRDLADIKIIVPSLEEQQAIAKILSDMDSEIEQLEKKFAKYQQIKQGMMQELLTGHIRLVGSEEQNQDNTQIKKGKTYSNHSQQFDDAVMIAGIINAFYSDKYPLGRKKLQKLLYLVRRKEQADISSFHKKAAGPYADTVRYKGGEPIAKTNKYIQETKSKMGSCFSKGENIQQALTYLKEWNKQQDIEWLILEFQYTKVDELELLATVDMAMCDLHQEGKAVTVRTIKDLIQSTKEWRDKLKKTYFSDFDIQRAIIRCKAMFKEVF